MTLILKGDDLKEVPISSKNVDKKSWVLNSRNYGIGDLKSEKELHE